MKKEVKKTKFNYEFMESLQGRLQLLGGSMKLKVNSDETIDVDMDIDVGSLLWFSPQVRQSFVYYSIIEHLKAAALMSKADMVKEIEEVLKNVE